MLFHACKALLSGRAPPFWFRLRRYRGPFLFALALHPCATRLQTEFPDVTSIFYLDDGALIGPADQVFRAWAVLQSEVALVNLKLSIPKCELFDPAVSSSPSTRPEGIQLLDSPGLTFLARPSALTTSRISTSSAASAALARL